jgi:hypothetical protein
MRPKVATLAAAAALVALVGCARREGPPTLADGLPQPPQPVTVTDGQYVPPPRRPAFPDAAVPPPPDIAAVLEAVNDPDIKGHAHHAAPRDPAADEPIRIRPAARSHVTRSPLQAPPGKARPAPKTPGRAPYMLAPPKAPGALPTGKSRLLSG